MQKNKSASAPLNYSLTISIISDASILNYGLLSIGFYKINILFTVLSRKVGQVNYLIQIKLRGEREQMNGESTIIGFVEDRGKGNDGRLTVSVKQLPKGDAVEFFSLVRK